MSRRFPSNLAQAIQFTRESHDVSNALSQNGKSTVSRALGTMGDSDCIRTAPAVCVARDVDGTGDVSGEADVVAEELAWRNLMRAASYGDPLAQFDLGVEAMRRIVGEGK